MKSKIYLLLVLTFICLFSFGQTNWTKHSGNPILSPGQPGEWDDFSLFPFSVLFIDGAYHMWYGGFDETNARIGYATSTDGINWTKYEGNPVLDIGNEGSWDDDRVQSPYVLFDGDTYHMWYTGSDGENYRFGYATSTDRVNWTKHEANPVLDLSPGENGFDAPCIIVKDNTYHMWYHTTDDGAYRICYASSTDKINWTKYAGNPVLDAGEAGAWDSAEVLAPEVYFDGAKFHMWYSGNNESWTDRIGYATSSDGIIWLKYDGNPVLERGNAEEWDSQYVSRCRVIKDNNSSTYKMWYGGGITPYQAGKFGYAESPYNKTLINVPEEIATIQGAIDATNEGDTVLVAEGTYFENINYKGKAITVASQFILDGDTSHISRTIIDGSQPNHADTASVVTFDNGVDTTSVLCGFTITGGKGTLWNYNGTDFLIGGGIRIEAGGKIAHNIIKGNEAISLFANPTYGAGIGGISENHTLIIKYNTIRDNYSRTGDQCQGGGIGIFGAEHKVFIEHNVIENNSLLGTSNRDIYGAGILFVTENPQGCTFRLNGNKIINNEAEGTNSFGGGLFFRFLSVTTSQNDLVPSVEIANNIFADNKAKAGGGGMYFENNSGYRFKENPVIVTINNTMVDNTGAEGPFINNNEFHLLLMNNALNTDKESAISGTEALIHSFYNCAGFEMGGVNNIYADTGIIGETYELDENSPCIGRGAAAVSYDGTMYEAPPMDINGKERPSSSDSFVDIGAIESGYPRVENPTVIKVPTEIKTIQAAINAADEGDTVMVAEGTYYENIDFKGKAITVASTFIVDGDTSHISKTIIDGSQPSHPDTAPVVRFMADQDTTSVLCGFTITGGKGLKYNNEGTYIRAGGGIAVRQGAKIENNIIHANEVISDNLLALGGGIVANSEGKDVVIRHNMIRDNICSTGGQAQGGGINLAGENNKFIIENNTIQNNEVHSITDPLSTGHLSAGAGLLYLTSNPKNCTLIIKGNKITGNKAKGNLPWGGGVYIEFIRFTASQDGLIPDIEITNNIIANNSAGKQGGGLWFRDHRNNYFYSKDPMPVMVNNTITGNTAPTGREIYNSGLKIVLMNNIIWNDLTPLYATDNGSYIARYNDIKDKYSGDGNIDADPMLDPETFELQEASPCIGKGIDSVQYNGNWYYAPNKDYRDSSVRANPVNSRPDIGARESSLQWPVSVPDVQQKTGLVQFYPNPSANQLNIDFVKSDTYSINLISATGQVLYHKIVSGEQHQIDLGSYTKGLYFIRVRSKEFVWTEKVTKK